MVFFDPTPNLSIEERNNIIASFGFSTEDQYNEVVSKRVLTHLIKELEWK